MRHTGPGLSLRWALLGVPLCCFALPQGDTPTYSRDIAPVIAKSCFPCHQSGGAAPFALANYDDVKKRAQQVVRNMAQKLMPPCVASSDFGSFCSYPAVTDQQLIAFDQWVTDGAKFDSEPAAPAAGKEWALGKPDAVVKIGSDAVGPLDGRPVWRTVSIALPDNARGFVKAIDVRPLSPRAIRHITLFATSSVTGTTTANGFIEDECENMIGAWAPGYPPVKFPPGVGKELRNGLRMQVLMVPTGKQETAECEVALYFAAKGVEPEWLTIGSNEIAFPPNLVRNDMQASLRLPVSARLLSVVPEARLLCRRFSIAASMPDGSTKMIFDNDRYDAYWQGSYRFFDSAILPKGTLIVVNGQYDNSKHGGRNLDPKLTGYGHGLDDELFWAHIEYLPVDAEP